MDSDSVQPAIASSAQTICNHFVRFYEQDKTILDAVNRFVSEGVENGEAAVVVGTAYHLDQLRQKWREVPAEQVTLLDAENTLSQFMRNGRPVRHLFRNVIGNVLQHAAKVGNGKTRVYGEMVALLWAEGNQDATLELEGFWNELSSSHEFQLLCAYPMGGFDQHAHGPAFQRICSAHSHVHPVCGVPQDVNDSDSINRYIAGLEQKAKALESGIPRYMQGDVTETRHRQYPNDTPVTDQPPLQVLVVDDDLETAKALGRLLRSFGHGVHISHSGADAHMQAALAIPDLILLDVAMPQVDGYAVARDLRTLPALANAVLIAFSGSIDAGKARAAGFDSWLEKPIGPGDIEKVLAMVRKRTVDRPRQE